jgi:2-polyprenyl-3-methyl-5-hydroxy-6-metoxy-1,4-benzoquinol methylase
MEGRGWQCWGVELSATSVQAARSKTKATLHLGTLDDFSHPPEYFDCIAAFDLLAHLTDPVTTLRQAAALLLPGGWLVLSTVNEGWPLVPVFQRLFSLLPHQTAGLRDEMYEAQHYAYFDKSTLTRLMGEAGLELHTVEPLAPFSARHFRHQYGLTKRLALTGMLGLDRLMGASRKMLVAARKPLT